MNAILRVVQWLPKERTKKERERERERDRQTDRQTDRKRKEQQKFYIYVRIFCQVNFLVFSITDTRDL